MRSNRKILFGVVILVAVVLLFGVYKLLSGSAGRVVATNPTANPNVHQVSASRGQVAVAAVDIPPRSIITPDMLKMQDYNGPSASSFVTTPDTQAVGFITRVGIPKGSEIRPADDLVGHISQVGIAGALNPGMRALIIPIGNKPTLHELVRIGNYVDVLAAFDGQEARTIVPGVRVLAVDIYDNDFPEKSAAVRGPFKTGALPGSAPPPVAAGAPADPNATGTPTPTPPPANQPRPDPSMTLEVTPQQAATIHLAIASGATLDYLLLPSLPGNLTTDPTSNGGAEATTAGGTTAGGTTTSGETAPAILPVEVTKAQIAPYAERKKMMGQGGGVRTVSTATSSNNTSSRHHIYESPGPMPTFPAPSSGSLGPAPIPANIAPPTYSIPIYADGKVVRQENVLTPQE